VTSPPSEPINLVGFASRRVNLSNYCSRHWRGDFSLGISCCISIFVGNGVFYILRGLSSLVMADAGPTGSAVSASLQWSLALALAVWLSVGIWRSAGKHRLGDGRRLPAVIARLVVVAGFVGLGGLFFQEGIPVLIDMWLLAAGDPEFGKHRLTILPGNTELEYTGGITVGVADEVRKLLDADTSIGIIRLNSNGGRVGEAIILGDIIQQRRLSTYVVSVCASACTEVFLGGAHRYIAPGGKLGFHRLSVAGGTAGQLAQLNDIARQLLIARGVAKWFANRAFSTPPTSMWWPTFDELLRAGVITGTAGDRAP
jgi:hypothetical protein